MLRTALLLITLLLASVAMAKDLSLEEIRAQLLNQEVVVLGTSFSGDRYLSGFLVDWYLVKGDAVTGFERIDRLRASSRAPETFQEKMDRLTAEWRVPETFRGKRGFVVSIEFASEKAGEKDAFGNQIDNSRVKNPYIKVVVKVPDGEVLIGTTHYYNSIIGRTLQLVSVADSLKKEIESHLAKLIGKTLYKAGYTKLLDSTLSSKELLDRDKRELYLDHDTKNLTPLKVIDTKFLEAERVVVLKVELPNGETRLLFGESDNYDITYPYKRTLLQRIGISAEEKIPEKFSRNELAAIKGGEILRGMSLEALYWSWGYPEKTNDYGRGGKQLIYHINYGNQYIYVDGKMVRNWQFIQ